MSAKITQDLDIVIFSLGDEEYGIPISQVQEIIDRGSIMYVPRAEPYIKGLINLRGSVVPVMDLAMRIETSSNNNITTQLIIVVEIKNNLNGLIVDSVSEVVHIKNDAIDNIPLSITGQCTQFLYGVTQIANRLVMLLDLNTLLSDTKLTQE